MAGHMVEMPLSRCAFARIPRAPALGVSQGPLMVGSSAGSGRVARSVPIHGLARDDPDGSTRACTYGRSWKIKEGDMFPRGPRFDMTASRSAGPHVLICGGGVAGIETLLALRALAGHS